MLLLVAAQHTRLLDVLVSAIREVADLAIPGLSPLSLDTNHGYAKEQVVNSELAKRRMAGEGRARRLDHLAQLSRARLTDLFDQSQQLQEQIQVYEQQCLQISLQVAAFETTGQTEGREYFPV